MIVSQDKGDASDIRQIQRDAEGEQTTGDSTVMLRSLQQVSGKFWTIFPLTLAIALQVRLLSRVLNAISGLSTAFRENFVHLPMPQVRRILCTHGYHQPIHLMDKKIYPGFTQDSHGGTS